MKPFLPLSVYDQFCTHVKRAGKPLSRSKMGFDAEKRQELIARILLFDRYKHLGLSVEQELTRVFKASHNGFQIPIPWYVTIEALENSNGYTEVYQKRVMYGTFQSFMLNSIDFKIFTSQINNDLATIKLYTKTYKELENQYPRANKTTDRIMFIWYCLQLMPDFRHVVEDVYNDSEPPKNKNQFFIDIEECFDCGITSNEIMEIWTIGYNSFHTLASMKFGGLSVEDIIHSGIDRAVHNTNIATNNILQSEPIDDKTLPELEKFGQILLKANTMRALEQTGIVGQKFNGQIIDYKPFKKIVDSYCDDVL